MSKKIFIIAIIVILLSFLGFGAFLYFSSPGGEVGNEREEDERDFFPFQNGASSNDTYDGFSVSTSSEEGKAPVFRQVSADPVSGAISFSKDEEIIIRYNKKENGHIFETPASSLKTDRISNKTMPKINEVLWSNSGNLFLARYLDEDDETVKTFLTEIKIIKEEDKKDKKVFETNFLKEDIEFVSLNKKGGSAFMVDEKENETIAYIKNLETENTAGLFSSKVNGWIPLWPGEGSVYLLSKPSYITEGVLLSINTSTGEYKKTLRGIKGLNVKISPDEKYILYNESNVGSFKTYIKSMEMGDNKKTTINTFPEKCAWSKIDFHVLYCAVPRLIKNGKYPDDWYQGETDLQDDIWKIDAKDNISEKIYTINENEYGKINATNLKISPEDKYLIFEDKNDSSLWSLRIQE